MLSRQIPTLGRQLRRSSIRCASTAASTPATSSASPVPLANVSPSWSTETSTLQYCWIRE
ncbi:BQ2448_5885 [Microbotryum intermedium]|uniref:BQ2448_5885 protein n=1 Tax=Microbotryum intermedium TaxID=269621 RepID=A0A238F3D0_9BASI|nr:BQ2448_5885 [Microbotryum intermedium]